MATAGSVVSCGRALSRAAPCCVAKCVAGAAQIASQPAIPVWPPAAARLLAQLVVELGKNDTVTFLTHTRQLPDLRGQVASCLADAAAVDRLFRFFSTDQAIEWCEDELLEDMHPATHAGVSDLRTFEITAGLAAEELDVLGRLLVRRSYPRGERIIRLGDEATNLFLVTRGLVGVWLGEPADGSRVASFSAGTMVGELAFIDGERRSGNVVAEADVE